MLIYQTGYYKDLSNIDSVVSKHSGTKETRSTREISKKNIKYLICLGLKVKEPKARKN